MISELFDETRWEVVPGFEFSDITYHRAIDQGTVRVAISRPEVRNAFRPHTVDELYRALDHARMSSDVGCILLTGNGPSPKDGGWAFCSGGDQRIRGQGRIQVRRLRRCPRSGTLGPAAYPRGAATHSIHAKGRDRGRAGMGRWWRAQPPCRL